MPTIHNHVAGIYRRLRAASRGARLSLLNDVNGFCAMQDCAAFIKDAVPGLGEYSELGDGILEPASPKLFVHYKDMPALMEALLPIASVALVDIAVEKGVPHYHTVYFQRRAVTQQPAKPQRPEVDDLDALLADDHDDLLGGL